MTAGQTSILSVAVSNLRSGRLGVARQGFSEAFEIAKRADDPIGMAEAALGLGGMWVHEHRTFDERAGFLAKLEMASIAVAEISPLLLARLDVRYGAELVYVGKGSERMVREAVERLRTFDDPTAEAEALSLVHHLLLAPDRALDRFAIVDELMVAAARSGDDYFGALALMWHTIDLFMSGSPFAERGLEALRLRSQSIENVAIAFIVATLDVTLAIRSGDLKRAEELAGIAFALGVECGDPDAEAFLGGQLLCCRWLQGNSGELLSSARRLQSSPSVHFANPLFSAAVAVLAAEGGEIDEARRAISHTLSVLRMPRVVGISSVHLSTYFALSEAAALLGDRDTAQLVLEYLAPFADLPITGSLAVSCFGSTERSIAVAHGTLGNVELAIECYRRAIDDNLRFGHLPMVAICRAELAEILADEGLDAENEIVLHLSEAIRIGTTCRLDSRVERWKTVLNSAVSQFQPRAKPTGDHVGALHRSIDSWTIVCTLGSAIIPLRKGMEHIAVLLQDPGRSISIAELVGTTTGSRQSVLDARAQIELRDRVRNLQADLDEALTMSDSRRSELLRVELDRILDETERATGLFGRSRSFVDDAERARTAVQKSIRRVIEEIAEQAPTLGEELRKGIRTGSRCMFVPSELMPAHWVLRR
jgi:tetratricopeptide (TPR) repeat protein